ncbi:MAG: hypothetical protein R6W77_00430 [Trueperaceae bacterium]
MSSAALSTPAPEGVDNERVLGVYGLIFGALATLGILYFWIMGAILLLGGNGGLLTELGITGTWRWLFMAYPFVALLSLVLGVALFMFGRIKEGVGMTFLAPTGVALYYLALVILR